MGTTSRKQYCLIQMVMEMLSCTHLTNDFVAGDSSGSSVAAVSVRVSSRVEPSLLLALRQSASQQAEAEELQRLHQ